MTLSFGLFAARVQAIYRLPHNRAMNSPWNVGRLAQVFAVSFCVSVGSVLATVTPDSPPGQRVVELGPPIDLADMVVTKQAGSMKLGAANVSTNSLTFQVDEKSCFIYATPEGSTEIDWFRVIAYTIGGLFLAVFWFSAISLSLIAIAGRSL